MARTVLPQLDLPYSASCGASERASWPLVELDRAGGLPAPRAARARAARRDPRGPARAGTRRCHRAARLAAELGVSRGVVTTAYDQLAAEGYLDSRQGAPVRVARGVRAQTAAAAGAAAAAAVRLRLQSRACPISPAFPRDRWLRSLRAAWRETPLDAVGYGDPRGVPELREALADYLGRVRGVAADAEQLLVCTGFRQGLSLTCRWLRGQGIERIALEDPGWHAQRLIVEEAGLEVAPIPVDADGIDVGALERQRRRRGRRHRGAPVPDRRRAEPATARGADRLGRARRPADHRGRLRRRALPRPGRSAAGARAGPRPATSDRRASGWSRACGSGG